MIYAFAAFSFSRFALLIVFTRMSKMAGCRLKFYRSLGMNFPRFELRKNSF